MKTRYTVLKGDRQWKSAIGLDEVRFLKLAELFKSEYRAIFGKSKEENAEGSPVMFQKVCQFRLKTYRREVPSLTLLPLRPVKVLT